MQITYSPSPSGRGRGEGQTEPRRALAVPRPPYADLRTAIGSRQSNHQKHGIDFADAATVFDDDYFVSQEDLTARGEQRFTGTGMDAYGRILTVVYTMPSEDDIHLISARRATRRERSYYAQRRH
jgi:uncharacterized protein